MTLDKFEGPSAPTPWVFSNGPEFPGASGSLSIAPGHSGVGAHLAYNTSAGGNYVAAIYSLPTATNAAAISLWVKSPGGVRVQIRVNDSVGQTLQYSPNRPFEATDAGQWYPLVVKFVPTSDHFGGSVNDGMVHGAITSVSVMAQPTTTKVGAIDFDTVKLIEPPIVRIDPKSLPAAGPTSPNFGASVGVEITHLDATDTGLNLVQSLGFSYVTTEMFWGDVETSAGVYDFTYYDQLFASLKARGLHAHWILCYGNPLYTGPIFLSPPRTAAAILAFANFAGAAAAHFAGQNSTFEVWNEPDLSTYWPTPSASEYSALYEAVEAQIHLADPTALAVTGGLAGIDLAFFDAMSAVGGVNGADAIGLHPYRLEAPELLANDLPDLRTHIAHAAPGRAPTVWSTEAGYSSAWYGDGNTSAARIRQAKYSTRQMLTGLALGLPSQTFFALRDAGTDTTATEENFGIVDNAYQAKILTTAVQTLLNECKARTYAGILAAPSSDTHVLKFESPDETLLVLWSEAPTGAAQRIYFSTLPEQAIDYLGNPLSVIAKGKKRFSVKIKDAPVYVTFPANR